jgi:putative PIN family toxin of toxin-antitoxin system
MKIMFDTNVLLSAALFPNERINEIIESITKRHELVIPTVVIKEMLAVAAYPKFDKVREMKKYVRGLSFTKYRTPKVKPIPGLEISDDKDYSILFAAYKSGVDILISGDDDFLKCKTPRPRVMTLGQYAKEYLRMF